MAILAIMGVALAILEQYIAGFYSFWLIYPSGVVLGLLIY